MTDQSNGISPIGSGIGLGVVGAAGGYFAGGKRPTIEKLVAQKPDSFEKTFSENVMKNASAEQKTAVATLKEAATSIDGAAKEAQPAINTVRKEVIAKRSAIDLGDFEKKADLESAVTKAKDELKTARDAVKFDEKYKNYDEAKTALRNNKDAAKKADLETAFNKAKGEFEGLKDGLKSKREVYTKAQIELGAAKEAAYKKLESAEGSAKKTFEEAATKLKTAIEGKKTAVSNKLKAVIEEANNKEAYGKVKKMLPKEGKGKSALIYGVGALIVGYIGAKLFGGKKETVA